MVFANSSKHIEIEIPVKSYHQDVLSYNCYKPLQAEAFGLLHILQLIWA